MEEQKYHERTEITCKKFEEHGNMEANKRGKRQEKGKCKKRGKGRGRKKCKGIINQWHWKIIVKRQQRVLRKESQTRVLPASRVSQKSFPESPKRVSSKPRISQRFSKEFPRVSQKVPPKSRISQKSLQRARVQKPQRPPESLRSQRGLPESPHR